MTWGKISTKFYLDTKLKPQTIGNRVEIYPLYVRVICKKQVSQFKYFGQDLEPKFFSKKEFEEYFSAGSPPIERDVRESKSVGRDLLKALANDVEYILNYLDAFDRDNFKIKHLPSILKSYYENEKSVKWLASDALIKQMVKKGYGALAAIIDWKDHSAIGIETVLIAIQDKFNLPKTTINYDKLPFQDLRDVLEKVKNAKVVGSPEKTAYQILKKMDAKTVKGYEASIEDILVKAINFYSTSFKLTQG